MGEHIDSDETLAYRQKFVWIAAIFQFILIILFGTLTNYGDSALSASGSVQTEVDHLYPFYQDVHVMIFIGFGFLMTFLKKYTFGAVGFNFLIAAFAIQWSMIVNAVAHHVYEGHVYDTIELAIKDLITSDFAAGAVLITFGAVLGKASPLQMVVVLALELVVYAVNETIGASLLGAVDMGGSIFVHTFGAYFGLALSRTLTAANRDHAGEEKAHPLNGSTYNSDTFAMIGTLFLWMYWPSFNGALAEEAQQHRVVINTVLSLCASCTAAFIVDASIRPGNKFDMVSIQNATLAGGVAVGSSSDLVIRPWGAITVGAVAGMVSVLGYVYLQPYLAKRFGLDDTCGVHNLHGIPGIIGAVGGAISAATAGDTAYGDTIGTVFPRRDPAGDNLSATEQASIQVAALFVTLAFAIVGGVLTGFVVKHPFFLPPAPEHPTTMTFGSSTDRKYFYQDEHYWEVPEENDEKAKVETEIMEKELELQHILMSIKKSEDRKDAIEKTIGQYRPSTDRTAEEGKIVGAI